MTQQEHERACEQRFGKPYSEIHEYLDHFYRQFRGNNHRLLLHHQKGVELAVSKFGEEARGPAEQHIFLDYGKIPQSWHELQRHFFPTSPEEEVAIEEALKGLYGEGLGF